MSDSRRSLQDLRQDLDETNGVIDILERASRELTTIVGYDEVVRKNPLRQRQLSSITEQLTIARGRRSSIARVIEQLEARSHRRADEVRIRAGTGRSPGQAQGHVWTAPRVKGFRKACESSGAVMSSACRCGKVRPAGPDEWSAWFCRPHQFCALLPAPDPVGLGEPVRFFTSPPERPRTSLCANDESLPRALSRLSLSCDRSVVVAFA